MKEKEEEKKERGVEGKYVEKERGGETKRGVERKYLWEKE